MSGPLDPKAPVRRLVEDVMNGRRLEALDDLYEPRLAGAARRWIAPFLDSFPDARMEVVEMVAEGERVAARLPLLGPHLGGWRGHPPTGRRVERVDEVYFFTVRDGHIVAAWALEDTRARLGRLGLPAG